MINNKKKDNVLIKRNQLAYRIKKEGIKRVDKEAVMELNRFFEEYVNKLIKLLKWEMQTNARKTLRKWDVEQALKILKEEDGIKIYFWDTYAIIELLRGNPNYSKYFNEEVTITIFNLAEIYWSALNDLVLGNPEEIYEKYSQCVVEIPDETLKESI